MSMNTSWGGQLTLPKEHYTEERFIELLEAMNIGGQAEELGHYFTGEDQDSYTMEPGDTYGGYLYEDRIPAALAALQAQGYIRAESDFDVMEFEADAGHVRIWERDNDAMVSGTIPGHIRLDSGLYALTKVADRVGDAFPWSYPDEPSLSMEAPGDSMRICWPGMGERLRSLRAKTGLSQEAVGEAVGISWMTVHRFETGRRGVIYKVLVRLLELYDVDINEFLPSPVLQEAA